MLDFVINVMWAAGMGGALVLLGNVLPTILEARNFQLWIIFSIICAMALILMLNSLNVVLKMSAKFLADKFSIGSD